MAMLAALLMASGGRADAQTKRILIVGDSWPAFIAQGGAFDQALPNMGYADMDWYAGIGINTTAIGGSEIEEWAYSTGLGAGALDRAVGFLEDYPTIDIIFVTMGGNDFLGRWSPESTPAEAEQIWYEARYGVDGQGGLKKIFDTLLAVRPDVKILFSAYDYIGQRDTRIPDMDAVQAYNEANELFTQAIVEFVDNEYKSPPFPYPRAFVLNNLGLMQYVFGYPGPNPETIPSYFWPPGPPATPHAFRFDPGPGTPGNPPFLPGNESSGFVPLAGGDPDFRISPYIALLDPPIDGWIHLSNAGYEALAEHSIVEYMAAWFETPKVYAVSRATLHPLGGSVIGGPIGFDELAFEVTFSEPVQNVDGADFDVVMGNGLAGAYIESVTGSKDGETYTVVVDTGDGDGTLGLEVLDNDSIVDSNLVPLGGIGPSNGAFAAGQSYTVDRSVGMPVCAWPVALALLAAGACALHGRSRA